MAKRKKIRQAGPLVEAVIYTAPEPNDGPRVRAEKSRATDAFRQFMNDRTARRRLEFLIAGNFRPADLFLTLTYREEDLPPARKEAQKKIAKFLRDLRRWRRKLGRDLKYIYVTEDKHGEGRLHHHLIINATERDIETVRALWVYGDVCDMEPIGGREFEDWAGYMTKEGMEGRPVGARLWTPSRNLKPPVERSGYVDNDETLTFPPGVVILEEQGFTTRDAHFKYIKYRIPPRHNRREPPRSRGEPEAEEPIFFQA